VVAGKCVAALVSPQETLEIDNRMKSQEELVFEPIRNVRISDEVAIKLEERIVDGTFAEGDLLPSEKQLSEQLEVGRRAIREALRVLEMKGLVEVQMGVGTFVRRNDLDRFLQALTANVRSYLSINKADIRHVMELRWILESHALEDLLVNPDEARMTRLAEIVVMQRKAYEHHDAKAYQEWHFRFHCEVVRGLNNPVVEMIYRQVLDLVRRPMEQAGAHPEVELRAIGDHEQMLEAIRQGEREDLRAILNRHLENFIIDLSLPDVDVSQEWRPKPCEA